MQRLIILLVLLVAYQYAFGQGDSVMVWNEWCQRRDTLLLFTASYNVIKVYSPSFKPADITLRSLDKTLKISEEEEQGDTLTVLAMPYTTEKPMRLSILSKSKNKLIKTVSFDGAEVPTPKAKLGNIRENAAPKENIIAQTRLKVVFPNSLYSYPYRVTEFVFKLHYDKADIKIPVKGSRISDEIERNIRVAPVGSTIEFTGIKATCPECITRDLDDLQIKIK